MSLRSVLLVTFLLLATLVVAALGWYAAYRLSHGSLAVDAASVNSSNEPEAQAREIFFYLLDEDLIKLAMEGGNPAHPSREEVFREHPRLGALAGLMNARRREAYSLGPDVFLLFEQSRPLWASHVVEQSRADARGRVRFGNLAPGVYWLAGGAKTRDGSGGAFWNIQVNVKRGEKHIKLDENNALYFRRAAAH